MNRLSEVIHYAAYTCTSCKCISVFPKTQLDGVSCLRCKGGPLRPAGDARVARLPDDGTGFAVSAKINVDTKDLEDATAKAGQLQATLTHCKQMAREIAQDVRKYSDDT